MGKHFVSKFAIYCQFHHDEEGIFYLSFYLEKVHRMMQAAISIYESLLFIEIIWVFEIHEDRMVWSHQNRHEGFNKKVSSYNSLFLAMEVRMRFVCFSLLTQFISENFEWSRDILLFYGHSPMWWGIWCRYHTKFLLALLSLYQLNFNEMAGVHHPQNTMKVCFIRRYLTALFLAGLINAL